jgi:transmembrane sensor
MEWPFRKSPDEVAVRFWVKRHSGSWQDRDEKAFLQWLAAAAEHRVIYDGVVAACELAGRSEVAVSRHFVHPSTPHFLHWRTIGAVLLITLVAITSWQRFNVWWNGIPVTWTAKSNSPRKLELPDGTYIELDVGTEVITQWGSRARHATVVRGEALFSVSHDPTRPLIVDANGGRLTDMGTVFDVATGARSVKVAVLEGSVGVRTHNGQVVLTAGHGGGYERTGKLLPVTRVDSSVTSWREGIRRFDSVTLQEVLDILSRRHGVQFSFRDAAVAELRLSGTLRMENLPVCLRTLGTALQLQVHWVDEHRVELSTKATGNPNTPLSEH